MTTNIEQERLQQELQGKSGRAYWKRLEAFCESDAFTSYVESEYPSQLGKLRDAVGRRDFLRLMGGSLAVAGFGACTRQPDEKILPYARTPESTIPGKPRFFATAMPLGGAALGLLVESHMGRPTKVEGNPDHPASLGATDSYAQGATLGLYDPDRSHSVLAAGQISTWDAFLAELAPRLERLAPSGGAGLRVLLNDQSSPTLDAQLARLREVAPEARIHAWAPLNQDRAAAGSELAFGEHYAVRYALDKARVLVTLDADVLASGVGGVRNARGFADGRRVRRDTQEISRFFAIESGMTLTGENADESLRVKPSEVEGLARALAQAIGLEVEAPNLDEERASFVRRTANHLLEQRGASLLIAGEGQSPAVHALVHAVNDRLGNVGTTLEYAEPSDAFAGRNGSGLRELVDDMRRGEVKILLMLGGNPVYDAPSDLNFAEALEQVPLRVHLSLYEDETSELCHWHLPEAHFLESWSDTRAFDGTASIVQPLIAPLYDGKSVHEVLAVVAGDLGKSSYDLVRGTWRGKRSDLDDEAFETFWATALHDGLIPGTRRDGRRPSARKLALGPAPRSAEQGLEIVFRRDPSVYDGRFANNGWLQELPRPLSLLTWGNAAFVSQDTADQIGAENGQVVSFTKDETGVQAAVWVLPGQPDGVVTMHLGYGRERAGTIGNGVGFDAYRLRTTTDAWTVTGVQAESTGERLEMTCVQDHAKMEGRDIVRVAEFDRFKRDPDHTFGGHGGHDPAELSMYPGYEYPGYAWGMVIDLTACIGCNACVVACQSENNVPIVGKEEVAKGRELHWLRVDRYFEADPSGTPGKERVLHQPVPCMHCEQAPCEVVCPVGATVHGSEGLNEMVYNRCVGTRYCSNNCPYKVRRFNFYHYSDYETESLKLGNNPDVTVRTRGVMEKCTYCVQRINEKRINAKVEDREITDGEVKTACQQVCPTQAISFGDINNPESEVSSLRQAPQHYALLGELGTRPRTTYLAKLTNPEHTPEADDASGGAH